MQMNENTAAYLTYVVSEIDFLREENTRLKNSRTELEHHLIAVRGQIDRIRLAEKQATNRRSKAMINPTGLDVPIFPLYQCRHKLTGNIYDVICIANDDATKKDWPTTVVYRDDKSIWSLPVDRWLEKFDLVKR